MRNTLLTLIFLVGSATFVFGATWDGSFEASPSGSDSVSTLDDRDREIKNEIRERMEVDHRFGTLATSEDDGRHREGSAVTYYRTACPATLDVADAGGDSSLGSGDIGRLCRDSDDGHQKTWNGSAWEQSFTAFDTNINFTGGAQVEKAGADAFDLHDHGPRHGLTGTSGAWVAPEDPGASGDAHNSLLTNLLNTNSTTGVVIPNSGAETIIGTISVDFTGRGAVSHGFVIGTVEFSATGSGTKNAELYLEIDDVTIGVGSPKTSCEFSSSGSGDTCSFQLPITNITAGAHDITVEATTSDNNVTASTHTLTYMDFGLQ